MGNDNIGLTQLTMTPLISRAIAVLRAAVPNQLVRAGAVRIGVGFTEFGLEGGGDHQVRFSVTTRIDTKIRAACDSIGDDQWIDIRYPQAVWDDDERRWISDAQIAETTYTAFAGTRHQVTARLIVRRIRRDDPAQAPGQEELLPAYRHHAVFTDSPFTLVQAGAQHRQHAVIEQINADLIAGPLAHLPSGRFNANAAWLTCAGIAHNLTRTAGHLAAGAWTTARTTTIRTRIVNVAARLAHRARTIHLHRATSPRAASTCTTWRSR